MATATVGQYDYLVPNGQYTFSFTLQNLFTLPDPNTLQGELTSLSFLQNVTVTSGGILQYTYNVTFVFVGGNNLYTADDIQSEIVSTLGIGGDNFSYVGASIGNQTAIQTNVNQATTTVQAAGQVASAAATAAGNAANAATNAAVGTDLSTVMIFGLIGLALIATIFIFK